MPDNQYKKEDFANRTTKAQTKPLSQLRHALPSPGFEKKVLDMPHCGGL